MRLFRSTISRVLDNKNRIVLPPDFREALLSRSRDGRMILTTLQDPCVRGYALPDWEPYEADLQAKLDSPDPLERNFARLAWGGAEELNADAQGRILLSKNLLEYSGISAEAVLVGLGESFELWSPERWAARRNMDFSGMSMKKQFPAAGRTAPARPSIRRPRPGSGTESA